MIRKLVTFMLVSLGGVAMAGGLNLDEFDDAIETLIVGDPSEEDPLSMSTLVIPATASVGESVVAVLKLRILPGWYIYADVPASQPFIEAQWHLEPDRELEIVDDWAGPLATPHKESPNTLVQQGGVEALVFYREAEVVDAGDGKASVDIGLTYQICSREYCLPPISKVNTMTVETASE